MKTLFYCLRLVVLLSIITAIEPLEISLALKVLFCFVGFVLVLNIPFFPLMITSLPSAIIIIYSLELSLTLKVLSYFIGIMLWLSIIAISETFQIPLALERRRLFDKLLKNSENRIMNLRMKVSKEEIDATNEQVKNWIREAEEEVKRMWLDGSQLIEEMGKIEIEINSGIEEVERSVHKVLQDDKADEDIFTLKEESLQKLSTYPTSEHSSGVKEVEHDIHKVLQDDKADKDIFAYKEELLPKLSAYPASRYSHKKRLWKEDSPKEIGERFELFVGKMYEKAGYNVEYRGIDKGVKDGGIDLIAQKASSFPPQKADKGVHDRGIDLILRNEKEFVLIQCKCWGRGRVIHENELNQFAGAVGKFKKKSPANYNIKAAFYTTSTLDDEAKETVKMYDIELHENVKMQ